MRTADEIQILEMKITGLENENRRLRATLLDTYAAAALHGLLAHGYTPRQLVVEEAFRTAEDSLKERLNHV